MQAATALAAAQLPPEVTRHEVQLKPVDARLRLTPCDSPLIAEMAGGRRFGRITVNVRCPGASGWSVHLTGEIKAYAPVVVASRPLRRDTLVSAADVTLAERELGELAWGYINDAQAAVGKRLRRALPAFAAVAPLALEVQPLVRRGQIVTVSARTGGVEVRTSATALGDGALGERVRMRHSVSKRLIEGTVTADGLVEVTLQGEKTLRPPSE